MYTQGFICVHSNYNIMKWNIGSTLNIQIRIESSYVPKCQSLLKDLDNTENILNTFYYGILDPHERIFIICMYNLMHDWKNMHEPPNNLSTRTFSNITGAISRTLTYTTSIQKHIPNFLIVFIELLKGDIHTEKCPNHTYTGNGCYKWT